MKFQTELVEQLDALSVALEDPAGDLYAILNVLTDDILAAVPSFVGLLLTVEIDGAAITISTMDVDSEACRSSLLLPPPTQVGPSACQVVLYAGHAHAFTELATHINRHPASRTQIPLDAHLPPPTERLYPSRTLSITDLSHINQAIGVLIEAGHPPAAARAVLHARAAQESLTLAKAAQRILQQL